MGSHYRRPSDFSNYFVSPRSHVVDEWQWSDVCQRARFALGRSDLAETWWGRCPFIRSRLLGRIGPGNAASRLAVLVADRGCQAGCRARAGYTPCANWVLFSDTACGFPCPESVPPRTSGAEPAEGGNVQPAPRSCDSSGVPLARLVPERCGAHVPRDPAEQIACLNRCRSCSAANCFAAMIGKDWTRSCQP